MKSLREFTGVQYGQQYLLEKSFPHLFCYGEGGWYYGCPIGFSQFTKISLLDPSGRFSKDPNFPFFMFDYMTKIRMRGYNARKIVGVSKLECQVKFRDLHVISRFKTILEIFWLQ